MAELLVRNKDNFHSDPDKDRAGCYKKHDIVVVMPDGHEWGREELGPNFYIVRLSGVRVGEMKKYIEEEVTRDVDSAPVVTRRRKWKLRRDLLPLLARSRLDTDRNCTVTRDQCKTEDKVTRNVE